MHAHRNLGRTTRHHAAYHPLLRAARAPPSPRRGQNRYGDYGAADAERSRLLIGLRQLDIPLEQAAELATMCAAGRCDEVSDELRALLREKRQQLARRMAEMV